MKHFQHIIKVTAADIDELGHVNNVVYVRYVQEVAAAHWDAVADEALRKAYKWVVLRHEIDYKSPAFENDDITGITWVGEHHGPRFERFVKLTSGNTGKVVAEAKTIWCMIDGTSGKPVRIGADVLAVL
jgi:acyl-CoA thioester hydrolase